MALTASALARARASATRAGSTYSTPMRCRTAASSTCGGTTRKGRPAASSRRRRKGLDDASRSSPRAGSAIARLPLLLAGFLPVVQQPDDGSGRLLDGAARHVDDRPAVAGAQAA